MLFTRYDRKVSLRKSDDNLEFRKLLKEYYENAYCHFRLSIENGYVRGEYDFNPTNDCSMERWGSIADNAPFFIDKIYFEDSTLDIHVVFHIIDEEFQKKYEAEPEQFCFYPRMQVRPMHHGGISFFWYTIDMYPVTRESDLN